MRNDEEVNRKNRKKCINSCKIFGVADENRFPAWKTRGKLQIPGKRRLFCAAYPCRATEGNRGDFWLPGMAAGGDFWVLPGDECIKRDDGLQKRQKQGGKAAETVMGVRELSLPFCVTLL